MAEHSTTHDTIEFEDLKPGMEVVEVNRAGNPDNPSVVKGRITELSENRAEMKHIEGGQIAKRMFGEIGGATYTTLYKDSMGEGEITYYRPENWEEGVKNP